MMMAGCTVLGNAPLSPRTMTGFIDIEPAH